MRRFLQSNREIDNNNNKDELFSLHDSSLTYSKTHDQDDVLALYKAQIKSLTDIIDHQNEQILNLPTKFAEVEDIELSGKYTDQKIDDSQAHIEIISKLEQQL